MLQSILVDKASPPDAYGQTTYTRTSRTCRIQLKHVSFSSGLTVQVSNALLYILNDIKVGDRVFYDNQLYTVKLVEATVGLFGEPAFYRCFLI